MDARMTAAFEHIANQHDGRLRDLVALTQTAAPPFAESARAALFASMLTETGFGEVTIDEVGNVIARRAGTSGARTLMVAAHIDTVFPGATDVTVRIDGNRFAAPGIGDNTRGAILLLELASAIVSADLRTEADLIFVGNVGEEGLGDLRGTRHLFLDPDQQPDSFIAIDGGGPNRIINSAVGSNRYRVTFRGEGGHSWGDFGAANPHHAAARAIAGFAVTARPVTLVGPRSSFSVGRIGGGTSVNSIPFESWFEVDMRSGNPGKIATIDRLLREAVAAALASENEARTENAALTVEIAPIGRRPAGVGDPRSPLVQRAVAVLRAASIEPLLTASSTDANVPISLGIPAITISRCGTSGRAHSLDEFWIDDDDVIPCTIRALTLVLAEAGLAD
jgi:acetylornithine deacetylase/succinyl-diaminopimelate desuccinylase-like protein